MARTLLRQSQIDYTNVDVVGYEDALASQLDATNHPETTNGTALIAAESATFSAAGSVVTMSAANPLTSGVVPGDDLTIAGSTSDDGTYVITAVTASTITVDQTFTAADGGAATAAVAAVRSLVTDLNYVRAQLRRVIGEANWYDAPTPANSPVLKDRKILYATENYTNLAIPASNKVDISSLGLSGFVDQSTTDEGVLASTSTPSAGGGFKSEGKHWVDLVAADTGEPITISGHRVYGYLVVDDYDTPTTEEVFFIYFNNATDGEVLVTDLQSECDQYGTVTEIEITYLTRSNLAAVPEDFGLAPIHLEAAIDQQNSLQEAYVKGEVITLSDGEGDLIVNLDETGTGADFALTAGTGDYLRTDAENATLDLGAAGVQVDVNGSFQVTGSNTFDVGSGQSTMDGNLDVGAGLDVTGVTNLGDGGTTNYAQFSAAGDLSLVGNADTISKSDGALTIEGTGQNVTLQTTTSGTVGIQSAGAVDIDGASLTADLTAGFSIDGAAASNVSVDGANLTLSTLNSGNVVLDAAGDLTFNDANWAGVTDPLPFSDAGNTSFTNSAAGAVSLIDAINQVAAEVATHEAMTQADSVPGETDRDTNVTIPGGLSYTLAADFASDFLIFVNGVKMRNGTSAASNYDVYPGSTTTTMRFEFKIKSSDVISAVKIA
jgi:hypothetical protein